MSVPVMNVTLGFQKCPINRSMSRSLTLAVLVLLAAQLGGLVPGADATAYFVNSATGSDTNPGTTAGKPWKTADKVNKFGTSPGFRPGDTIYFSGSFSKATNAETCIYFQLDKSYGNTTHPVTLTSVNPSSPATITCNGASGIYLYSVSTAAPKGLGFAIKNLIIKSNGARTPSAKTTSGIMVWHDSPVQVAGLTIDSVSVSGFTSSGIATYRASQARPYILDVQVLNTVAFSNPGFSGLTKPSGNGIVLSGVQRALIQNCTAYSNGAMNTNKAGPVGIWAYDADSVTIRGCTSHDNLSQGNDGGGFDLDGGTTNSVIEYCTSYNNYGYGYLFCSYNVAGSNYNTKNVTVRHSTSTNDAYGTKVSAMQVWPSSSSTITQAWVYNVTINIASPSCTLWTNNWVYPSALGVYSGAANYAGTFSDVMFVNNTVNCGGNVVAASLKCSATSNPNCVPI